MAACLLLAAASALFAQAKPGPEIIPGPRAADADFPPWNDPVVAQLGWQLPQAIEAFGAPRELGAIRGASPEFDAVVFYYADHSYLYWWGDRLWQLRFDRRYRGELMGVEMGMARAEVEKRLGKALSASPTELVYQLPDRGFPVRLRLIFANARLDDLYLYRADF